jgi:hypothetical protein
MRSVRLPSLPSVRLPSLPRLHLPSLPRLRLPSLPSVRLPSLPRLRLVIPVIAVLAGAGTLLALGVLQNDPTTNPKAGQAARSEPGSTAAPAAKPRSTQSLALLSDALTPLSDSRTRLRQRLARAANAQDQAKAAQQLKTSYRAAAARIQGLPSGGRKRYGGIVNALNATAGGYAGLAEAIRRGDQVGYDRQRQVILDGEAAVQNELDAVTAQSSSRS